MLQGSWWSGKENRNCCIISGSGLGSGVKDVGSAGAQGEWVSELWCDHKGFGVHSPTVPDAPVVSSGFRMWAS